jgi:hypothetical protein
MTLRRDPFSVHGAWFQACDALGWGTAANLCGKSDTTIREWSDPAKKGPPLAAIELIDKALHEAHKPKINLRAMDLRTGGDPPDALVLLADAERALRLCVRMLDGAPLDDERRSLAINSAALEVGQALNDVRQHALIKRAQHLDDLEAAADQPRFPEKPALRSVVGGR